MENVLRKFVVLPYSEYVRQQATIRKQFDIPRVSDPPSKNKLVPTPTDMNTDSGGCSGTVYVEALQPPETPREIAPAPTPLAVETPGAYQQAETGPVETRAEVPLHVKSSETSKSAEVASLIKSREATASAGKKKAAVAAAARVGSDAKSDNKKSGADSDPGKTKTRHSARKRVLKRDPDSVYWLTG